MTFVDGIHVAGRIKDREFDHAKAACRQLKSRMNSRGNQADDRKYRQPSLQPGAWNGSIIHNNTPFHHKSTTAKKWAKFKDGLQQVHKAGSNRIGFILTANLHGVTGLGVIITEVYPTGRCYLKGFCNAIESLRK